jgi:hypothetical protein
VKHVVPSHREVAKSRGEGVSEEQGLPAGGGAHYDADAGYEHETTRLETAAPVERAMTERVLLYAGRRR